MQMSVTRQMKLQRVFMKEKEINKDIYLYINWAMNDSEKNILETINGCIWTYGLLWFCRECFQVLKCNNLGFCGNNFDLSE